MRTIFMEEEGDEQCRLHLWCVYLDEQDRQRYRECRRCWCIEGRLPDGPWRRQLRWTNPH